MRKRSIIGKRMAQMYESHAEIKIPDLLEAVISEIEPKTQLNKLEGDAAFFFCDENNVKSTFFV